MKKSIDKDTGKKMAKNAAIFDKILPKNIPTKKPNIPFIKDFLLNKKNVLGLFLSKLEYNLIFSINYPF
jgi:hypothetical protein